MKAQPNTASGCIFLLFVLFKLLHAKLQSVVLSCYTCNRVFVDVQGVLNLQNFKYNVTHFITVHNQLYVHM